MSILSRSEETPILISDWASNQMEQHLVGCLPLEGCGLLFGNNSFYSKFVPVANIDKHESGRRFTPDSHDAYTVRVDNHWAKEFAMVHSHFGVPAEPSEQDIVGAAGIWADTIHIIMAFTAGGNDKRAWRYNPLRPVPLQVI